MQRRQRFPAMGSQGQGRSTGRRTDGPRRTGPAGDAADEPDRDDRQGRILVVDDNEDCRTALRTFLEASGFLVAEAADGEEAVERARETDPDLILLDIMMPGVDGLEAARRIRRASDVDGVMIVAISAMEGAEKASRAAGCDACVTKPLDMAEFSSRVGRWLSDG